LVTLILVPILYSIFVLDFKIVDWQAPDGSAQVAQAAESSSPLLQ
jgi:hypothetical protein